MHRAEKLTAIDASREMLDLCRERVGEAGVEFAQADLFEWQPTEQYDSVSFGYWLSHVPDDRFEPFWEKLRAAVKPRGRVFYVDSLFTQSSTATNHGGIEHNGVAERKLNDGSCYEIVKIFYEPVALEERLMRLGWDGTVRAAGPILPLRPRAAR